MVAILRLFRPPDGKWLGSEVAFVGDKAGAGWRFHVKASLLTSLASDSWLVLVCLVTSRASLGCDWE